MMRSPSVSRSDSLLATGLFVGLVFALVVIPRLVPPNPDVMSAAAADGYNTVAAFWTTACWVALTIAVFAVRRVPSSTGAADPDTLRTTVPEPRWHGLDWREIAIVFGLFGLAYCPLFLSRYAPFSEDAYFLAALGRLECGQLPYRDFGFLYGPSMIFLLWGWTQVFGASMTSYFGLLSLLEALQFALLLSVLQWLVPSRRQRYLVFLLLLLFLFNNLFGLNYNGLRFLIPTLVVVLAALRPHDRIATACCAVVLGVHLTYSHEYALAALMAVLGMHAALFFKGQKAPSARASLVIGVGSAATWFIVSVLLLRENMPSYIEHASDVVRMMSSGHAAFRFYWTANSLALFGLLTMASAIAGRYLTSGARLTLEAGPRLMLAAVLFAVVALRSGLTRADLWHLNPGFLPLIVAFLLPFSVEAVPLVYRRVGSGLVVIAAVTFLVGIAPMGSLYVTSYTRGLVDVLSGAPRVTADATGYERGTEFERTYPDEELIALSRYLNDPERAGRPVLFYGRTWDVPARIGVCPAHYKLDDLMYTEFTRSEASFLDGRRDTLVVMRNEDYRRLYGLTPQSAPHSSLLLTPVKQLGRWLSTVHYDAAETEARLQDEARERLTGRHVRSSYDVAAAFGDYVVLTDRTLLHDYHK